jgi:dihydropyrimidinase
VAADAVDLVIHGGTVVHARGSGPATVTIADGRIRAVLDADAPLPDHARAVDARGRLVLPGGVDPHCHVGQELGDYTALDDYETASRAALHGGTTTIVDFAIPTPGQTPLEAVVERRRLAGTSRCDTALHGCVIRWDDTTGDQIDAMVGMGVRTIKLFTTYRDVVMAEPDTVLEVMRRLQRSGGLAYVHAEADHVIVDQLRIEGRAGRGDSRHHAGTRPELAESAAVAQVLATAEHVGAPVYFVHQTTAEAVDLVRDARRRGVRAYTETCPHYLALDDSVYAGPHPERFVCCPPLRSAATVADLNRRAQIGHVDALGSDNCCYSTGQKTERADCVSEMPNGLPGVETRLPVAFTQLVVRGGMPLERFAAVFAANPARLNGLDRKGVIAAGADADLVVLDPAEVRPARSADLHMPTDYTPYEGLELAGWPATVVSGGRVVVDAEGWHDPGPVGRRLDSAVLPDVLLV